MIFKMRSPYDAGGPDLYLLIEKDANGTFFGVYDDIQKAKKCDGSLGIIVIPEKVIADAQAEYLHFGDPMNVDKRIVNEEYSR
jgi:hypothetical protein